MLRYSFWSTGSPSSSASIIAVVLIGVDRGLESFIPNFFNMSLVYLPWCTNVLSLTCLICSPRKNYKMWEGWMGTFEDQERPRTSVVAP